MIPHNLGPKVYKPYNPYVISIGIVVLLLLLTSLGIGLYSCNWSFVLNYCVTSIFFGIDSNEVFDINSSTNSWLSRNESTKNEGPPSYESLESVKTIYNPNHIRTISKIYRDIESPPPNYEDIDLSS